MSQDMKSYKQIITSLLEEICADEMESIQRAAQVMGDSIMRGQVIHVIGPGGHSNMAVEEMFSRAGGLACMLDCVEREPRLHAASPCGSRRVGLPA